MTSRHRAKTVPAGIELLDAAGMVKNHIKQYFADYCLTPVRDPVLALPDGWRFPYECHIDSLRARGTMVIFFVDKQGHAVEVEWNDFERDPERLRLLKEASTQPSSTPDPKKAIALVEGMFSPQAEIETIEPVWDNEPDQPANWQVGWRIRVLNNPTENPIRYVVFVGGTSDAPRIVKGYNKPQTQYLADKKSALIESEARALKRQRTTWNCMTKLTRFAASFGYGSISLWNVNVEYRSAPPGFTPDTVPVINLPSDEQLSHKSEIVYHELGHALWYLLYTRPPQSVDSKTHANALDGVNEGFADYIATILSGKTRIAGRKYDGNPTNIVGTRLESSPTQISMILEKSGEIYCTSSVKELEPETRRQ